MSRPIWKGHISFGLVNIPVTLYSGEQPEENIDLKLVDKRNSARVKYERVNEQTGEEVPWDNIVKGYEYAEGSYVLFTNEELSSASAKLTRTIEIKQFVEMDQISPLYFDKPYYLVPGKGSEKGYVLLREAISKTGKIGIATVVIRTRQYLTALLTEGDALILNLLRFSQELRDFSEFKLPGHDLKEQQISKKEVDLATQLIEGMTDDWKPSAYHDEYHDQLLKLIDKKVKAGKTEVVTGDEKDTSEDEPNTINFLDVLSQSVKKNSKPTTRVKTKKTPRKTAKKRRAS
jgi:DNA end-binding protein Ku